MFRFYIFGTGLDPEIKSGEFGQNLQVLKPFSGGAKAQGLRENLPFDRLDRGVPGGRKHWWLKRSRRETQARPAGRQSF